MTTPNTFSVMCYNVAGLPAMISSGNPSVYSVDMGKRIGDWDIVNVQEDFNYHAKLYSENKHEHRTPTSGGVPFGSGLNTLSHLPFTSITKMQRVKWNECSNFDNADCMTPKGFTLVEVQLADGVTIDIYNLHTDAGVTDADQKARASNLQQLSNFMTETSADNAVIVFGDTNTRYTRERDTIREFIGGQKLTDAWVQFVLGGVPPEKGAPIKCDKATMTNDCEVVDKIMYRGSNYIKLTLDKWNNENAAFLGADGSPLSDHPPISSTFSWTLNPDIHVSNAVGGPHGTHFTDVELATANQKVSSVTIHAGERAHGVTLEVSGPTESTLAHGSTGGTPQKLALESDEVIISMEAHWGKKGGRTRIFYLKFSTNVGRSVEGGSKTSSSTIITAPEGFQLSGFHGRDGDEIDALGGIFTKATISQKTPTFIQSGAVGGPHGNAFTDMTLVAAEETVNSITIRAGKRVDGVALVLSSPTKATLAHGGNGGTENILNLESGEYLVSMEAHWGKKDGRTRIFYLKFSTNSGRWVEGGSKTDATATMAAPEDYQIGGFHGRAAEEIDLLGVIFVKVATSTHQEN
ncbi:hypothetical protein JG687_00006755 [Phytophthora cactorum]|uniref:Jacalin-type lectin domain-containing protein n=1 Tax=Phytophthora cactorum TaxID=29920 RepID=A0A8T1UK75_9STRA|nr:hypothetical protein PC121_g10893 [Phytophthora cactorum]KAG6963101.1 hypothetical protein JG687_00006755 [Phytophthora cactorum]